MADPATGDLPDEVVDEAVRMTKLARAAGDIDAESDAAVERTTPTTGGPARTDSPASSFLGQDAETIRTHRDSLLETYGYTARVREESDGAVLVCYPTDWVDEDGVVRTDWIDDTDAAIEIRLSGQGDQGEFSAAEARNSEIASLVREKWGDRHGDNAQAFADFMSNHYARPIETASAAELEAFITEYYPRNVWPTAEQAAVLEQSLRYVFETTEESFPLD